MAERTPLVCEHGNLRRSCATCDLKYEIAALRAERDSALKAVSVTSEQAHQEWTRAQKAERERDEAITLLREWLSTDFYDQGNRDTRRKVQAWLSARGGDRG